MKICSVIIAFLITSNVCAQSEIESYNDNSKVDSLLARQVEFNKLEYGVRGYRVQIHFTENQNRDESEKMRGQISRDFPEYNTYLEFKAPYFKIQVGDFINKLNAFMLLKEISKSYRGAYIVPTTVYFEEINSEE
jgi:hypothetical protein